MKRLMAAVAVLVVVAFAGQAMAASSIAWTSYNWSLNNKRWIEVQAVVTAHTDGTVSNSALYANEAAEANGNVLNLAGFYLYSVEIYPGTTGPTDNSDLALNEHSATGRDVLRGAGANVIDNATNSYIQPLVEGTNYGPVPCYGPLYQVITNNAVNGGTFTIIYRFIQ